MDQAWLADVIERAQRRDPTAFEALVDAYSHRLYGFLYRLTADRDDADDLLQEVFVRVVRMIDKYEHDGRFEPWLFRIAMNLARDRVRRAKASPVSLVAESPTNDGEPRTGDPLDRTESDRFAAPGEAAELADQVDRLQQALEQLSEPERTVILLRHFSGMSFNDIAGLMDTPLGTALTRAHRGLKHLREIMEGLADDDG